MFLSKTLSEKLQKSYSQNDLCHSNKPLIAYQSLKKHNTNEGKVLFKSKQRIKYLDDINEGSMSKEEIIQSFTTKKMRQSWKQKSQINFTKDHMKFDTALIPSKAKEAMVYIKNIKDPDLYEYKQPRWDVSTKADEIKHPRLKQTMFNINSGLIPWSNVTLKPKHIEIGTDSRDHTIDNKQNQWNVSSQLLNNEKENMLKMSLEKSLNNTQSYWKKYAVNRKCHSELPITEKRKNIESPRYFKEYSNPTKQTITNYELMNKIKKELRFEMEDIRNEVIHENPGCKNIKEKIDALANKKMYKTFLKKFQMATGRIKIKDNHQLNPNEIYQWKDNELIEKIITINNWKDIDWYKNSIIHPKGNRNNSHDYKDNNNGLRIDLLKTLMPNGQKIMREVQFIKHSHKKKNNKNDNETIIKRCYSTFAQRNNKNSKFPIDLEAYNYDHLSDGKIIEDSDIINQDFLNAYKKYALKDVEKENKRRMADKPIGPCPIYEYVHPGIFKKFDYRKEKESNEQSKECFAMKDDDECYYAWSCCLGKNKDVPGCRKQIARKYQWNYDHNEMN